jgi:MFS family permease
LNTPAQSRSVALANAPIFFSFFTWGFGTGAQQLARPLFAYALTGNVYLVTLVIGLNALPRVFTGPITGYLSDRIGRKPLVMFGPALRGVTNVVQFAVPDFTTFLVMELVGQVGVSMWATSSNVLLADITTTRNRGRVLAMRQMALRVGFILGPLLGGVLAVSFGLRWLFLLNGISKVVILVVVFFMVSETRPERTAHATERTSIPWRERMRPFLNLSFVALGVAIVGQAMAQSAVLQTLMPVYAQEVFGQGESSIGLLISVAAVMALMVALPNGILSDRYGRKASLVPALALISVAAFLLSWAGSYAWILVAVAVQGSGEGMTMSSAQSYAMDMAPADKRGAYLGVVQMFQAIGGLAGPFVIGAIYSEVSPSFAFATLGGWLAFAAVLMAFGAKETAGRRVRAP